eukprot:TRINITY_DN41655_c0_g1_i1.p1 TRINITY_DN41655_c0_g1~~TRINITY_DN41655_c0_g1_i1.p1  ORF type:complete len:393 (-),score=58.05 TRINITY_DN41655_c0_g1_i1:725-1903(-)
MAALTASDRASYRALLRTCRQADRNPLQLVPLLGRPFRYFCPSAQGPARLPRSSSPFIEHAVWSVNGGCTEFGFPSAGAANAARMHCRTITALGFPYASEARALLHRVGKAQLAYEEADAAEMGFQEALTQAGQPNRPTRTQPGCEDIDQALASLERISCMGKTPLSVGDFLISHPLACVQQPGLDQAVILLTEIDDKVGHVRGIQVNMRGTQHPLRQRLVQRGDFQERRSLLELPMDYGGELSSDTFDDLRWLHALGDAYLPESVEIAPSIWIGDYHSPPDCDALEALQSGTLRLISGYSGWAMMQLAIELERGVWIRVRAPDPGAAQALCLIPTGLCAPAKWAEHSVLAWRAALQAIGCPSLAAFPRGLRADTVLRRNLEAHFETYIASE